MSIAGKYNMATTDKYVDFLKAIGVGMVTRNLAGNTKPTMEYILNEDGSWTQKTLTTIKSLELKFKSGEEFVETTGDGRESKSLLTVNGNTLTHNMDFGGGVTATVVRVFKGDEMTSTFTGGNVTAVRTFTKV